MIVKNKVIPNEEQINGFLENPEIGPISTRHVACNFL